MALTATLHRFEIDLSDVDRGVYETLDVRLARHPSESARYLFARALAYCLSYEEGLAFSKGLSTTEEPAMWIRDASGSVRLWIEIGTPTAERLHKARKASERVLVYTQHDPDLLRREAKKAFIFRVETIEAFALPRSVLDPLEPLLDRHLRFSVLRTNGQLYVTLGTHTLEGPVERIALAGERG